MKNKFFLFAALLGLAAVNTTQADEDWYVSVFGGGNWVNQIKHDHRHVKFDGGYVVGGTIGYSWCNDFAVEAEFDYRHNDVDKVKRRKCDDRNHHSNHGDLQSYAILGNLRYNIDCGQCFVPYVRAGIGYGNSKASTRRWDSEKCKHRSHSKTESGFAWKVGGGFTMPIDCNWSWSVGYDYLRAQKNIGNNSVTVAANYKF